MVTRMSAGRTLVDALRARPAHSELRGHGESAPVVSGTAADWGDATGALWIDQYELRVPGRESARPRLDGIRVDRTDRLAWTPGASVGQRVVHAGMVVAFLIVGVLGTAWIGGSGWLRFLSPASPSLPAPVLALSDSNPAAGKEDRLPIRGIADLAAREPIPEAPPRAAPIPKVEAPAPSKEPPAAPTHAGSINPPETQLPARKQLTPVPETRPATIPGWTVRDIVDGAAVLEGPDGVWRAARGTSVPGLGRVETIVRWGNHWIVATEKGLVSTH